eukprot:8103106-Pyramimonas_sp.AAC.1
MPRARASLFAIRRPRPTPSTHRCSEAPQAKRLKQAGADLSKNGMRRFSAPARARTCAQHECARVGRNRRDVLDA